MDCSRDNQEAFALSNDRIKGQQSDKTQALRTTHLNQNRAAIAPRC